MEIGNAIGIAALTSTQQTNSVSQAQEQTIEGIPDPRASSNISLSTEGKLAQQIDAASDQIDDILLRHVTPQQEKELNDIYQKLDQLFEKDQLTGQEERSADALFEQVHNILETSVDKLSSGEREKVDQLVNTMDGLMAKFDQGDAGRLLNANTPGNNSNGVDSLSNIIGGSKSASNKSLSVAELNALSAIELNKLPANLLKKLNSGQLNKLNAAQLNTLSAAQLNQLSANNLEKLNPAQAQKIS